MIVADFEITSRRSCSWRTRNSCKQSCFNCAGLPSQSAATLGISFLLVARLLRFALIRLRAECLVLVFLSGCLSIT
jgi:hypothetical protein